MEAFPMVGRRRSRRVRIGGMDFTALSSVDIGIAPGAKTVGGVAATMVHAGSAFLRADPDGCKITAGTGLVMDTTGASASTDDLNPANLTAALVFAWSDLVPSGQWGATEIALRSKYESIEAVFFFDASGAAATTELVAGAIGESTSWALGGGFRVGFAGGAASVGATLQTATFDAIGGTLANWGLGSLPNCARLICDPGGFDLFYGISPGGLVEPTTWYGQDARSNLAYSNLSAGTGGCMKHTAQLAFMVGDISGTGLAAIWKGFTLYGNAHPTGHTVTVS